MAQLGLFSARHSRKGGRRVATPVFDDLETRDPEARERSLMQALARVIAAAKDGAPAYRDLLAAVRPEEVTDRRALAQLPLTRKSALIEEQRRRPPFGGFAAASIGSLRRVFASPGPIYEPEGRRPDYWRFARALYAAGFRAGELVHNTFSYHLTSATPRPTYGVPGIRTLQEGRRRHRGAAAAGARFRDASALSRTAT